MKNQNAKLCIRVCPGFTTTTATATAPEPASRGMTGSCVKPPRFFSKKSFLLYLAYSVLSIYALQQSDPVLHRYMCLFSYDLPSLSVPGDWIEFPGLDSRTSLLIQPRDQLVSFTNPKLPVLPAPHPPSATTSLFSVSVSLFLFCRSVHLCQIEVISYGICLCLTHFTQ